MTAQMGRMRTGPAPRRPVWPTSQSCSVVGGIAGVQRAPRPSISIGVPERGRGPKRRGVIPLKWAMHSSSGMIRNSTGVHVCPLSSGSVAPVSRAAVEFQVGPPSPEVIDGPSPLAAAIGGEEPRMEITVAMARLDRVARRVRGEQVVPCRRRRPTSAAQADDSCPTQTGCWAADRSRQASNSSKG